MTHVYTVDDYNPPITAIAGDEPGSRRTIVLRCAPISFHFRIDCYPIRGTR